MRRSTITKLKAVCFILILMIIVLTGRTMFTSMAKEESSAVPYYKSVQIEDGDSLWKIADRYKEGSRLSTRAYVKELKQINGLKQDTIHAGQYLTVVYFPGE